MKNDATEFQPEGTETLPANAEPKMVQPTDPNYIDLSSSEDEQSPAPMSDKVEPIEPPEAAETRSANAEPKMDVDCIDPSSPGDEQSPAPISAKLERTEPRFMQKSTGPRSERGKERSKFNALKHGLLSKVLLLKGESPTEYLSLLNGLLDDLQPQGKLETLVVEDLAQVLWRKRRLLQAENAVVTEKLEFTERDSEAEDRARAAITSDGLLKHLTNPHRVREAKELLSELRRNVVARNGADLSGLLKQLFGKDQVGRIPQILRPHSGPAVDSSQIVAAMIDDEIKRLTQTEKDLAANDRLRYRKLAAVIPCQEVSEHLLRYERQFSGEIDRILNRLERLQRMRKGL